MLMVDDFEHAPSVQLVIMRGDGEKAFMSGGGISRFEDGRGNAEAKRLHRQVPDRFKT